MSKILIIEDCTKCPKDFRVGCTKLGNLGSPLNFINNDGFPVDCPLSDYEEPKIGRWIDDKCSICGKGTEDLIDSREWYQNEDPNFCPFCGVKIESEENK